MTSIAAEAARAAVVLGERRGCFVACFRNRPFGREEVTIVPDPDGFLHVQATTSVEIGGMAIRQEVRAVFERGLRPRSCVIWSDMNGEQIETQIEVGEEQARIRLRTGERTDDEVFTLTREPLLLVDNCFVLHALGGLAADRAAGSAGTFDAIPACEALTITSKPGARVLLGGHDFGPPDLTLHLGQRIPEHVWLEHGWVNRLVMPQSHMIVEWRTS